MPKTGITGHPAHKKCKILILKMKKYCYFCAGVSPIQAAPFNPPGAEASKGTRLSAVL
jgi:hypothetical protein